MTDAVKPDVLFNRRFNNKPAVSFVLIDWSVRESCHMLQYLSSQTVARDSYQVIWVEYYSKRQKEIEEWLSHESKKKILDTWIVMNMPDDLYYHKHLAYNVGIIAAQGEIVVFCDSDAMVKPTFVQAIIEAFFADGKIVLHMDELRSIDKEFYPFNYPDFSSVEQSICLNKGRNSSPIGLEDSVDSLHTRNYGACMAALYNDLISIGGADEHKDYLGYVSGPYEMTFRLINFGKKEIWHNTEWLYHVYHPGASYARGEYHGPDDGKNISLTALFARKSGRIMPLIENPVIAKIRKSGVSNVDLKELACEAIYRPEINQWRKQNLQSHAPRVSNLFWEFKLWAIEKRHQHPWLKWISEPVLYPGRFFEKIKNRFFFWLTQGSFVSDYFYVFLSRMSLALSGILFWIIAGNLYKAEDIGLASALISVTSLFVFIASLGTVTTWIRFVAQERDKGRLITTLLIFSVILLVIIYSIFLSRVRFFSQQLRFLVHPLYATVFFLIIFSMLLFNLCEGLYLAFSKTPLVMLLNAIENFVRLGLLFLIQPLGGLGIIAANALSAFFSIIVSLGRFFKFHPVRTIISTPDLSLLRQSFGFSLVNFANAAGFTLPGILLPLIVFRFYSNLQTGAFYISWMVFSVYFSFINALNSIFLMRAAHGEDVRFLAKKVLFVSLILGFAGLLVFNKGAAVILAFFKKELVRDGALILKVLFSSIFCAIANQLYITYYNIRNDHLKVGILSFFILFSIIAFTLLLIRPCGLYAVPLSWLLANLAANGYMVIEGLITGKISLVLKWLF